MIYNITIDDNAEFAEVLVRLLVTRCSKITEKIINFSFLIETTVLTFYGTMLLHNTDNHLIRLYEKKEHLCTFTYMQHASFAYSKCQILLSLIHGEVLSGIIENV